MSTDRTGEEQLTTKDRLNYPYLLASQILTIQKAILVGGEDVISKREIREGILGLVDLIPTTWKKLDVDWLKDYKAAKKETLKDIRPVVAGLTRLGIEECKKLGIKAYEKIEDYDYHKLFQACVDVLDRKRMLARRDYIQELERIEFYDDSAPEDAEEVEAQTDA